MFQYLTFHILDLSYKRTSTCVSFKFHMRLQLKINVTQGRRRIFSSEEALKIGRSPIWGWSLKFMLVLNGN